MECSLGTADTSTCSSSNDTSCPYCDTGIGDACSDHTIKLYQDASLYDDCTGADCNEIEEICYKEYDCTNGTVLPMFYCGPATPGPLACHFQTDFPVWCTKCKQDPADQGTPNPETSHSCPEES